VCASCVSIHSGCGTISHVFTYVDGCGLYMSICCRTCVGVYGVADPDGDVLCVLKNPPDLKEQQAQLSYGAS